MILLLVHILLLLPLCVLGVGRVGVVCEGRGVCVGCLVLFPFKFRNHLLDEERAGCFTLIMFLLSCYDHVCGLCSVSMVCAPVMCLFLPQPWVKGRSGVYKAERPSVSLLSSLHSSCEHLQELISNLIGFWLLPGL